MNGLLGSSSVAMAVRPLRRPGGRPRATIVVPRLLQYLFGENRLAYRTPIRFRERVSKYDRGWRRRQAEDLGEAFAVLFLEDSVGLDLSTLARVTERNDTKVPDFTGRARGDRRLAIEAKGASNWRYFTGSKEKARDQLTKPAGSAPEDKERAFVCRTFIGDASQDPGSVLAVEDPPVDFEAFFGREREQGALLEHIGAISALAGLTVHARLARTPERLRESPEAEFERGERAHRMRLHDRQYVGTALDLGPFATLLGRADVAADFADLALFQGVEEAVLLSLVQGTVRPRGSRQRLWREGPEEGEETAYAGVGIVPAPEGEGGFGVYSLMTDGSLVAVGKRAMLK